MEIQRPVPTYQRPVTRADAWLQTLFEAKAAREGRIIRRSIEDVERLVGWHRFHAELTRRGFHAVENAGQVVIFCNAEPVRVIR